MKLKPEQIKKLSVVVRDNLLRANVLKLLTNESALLATIESVLLDDIQKEAAIEAEAKKTMEKFRKQVESGEIDYQKMYNMVKKQLMKEKKFLI